MNLFSLAAFLKSSATRLNNTTLKRPFSESSKIFCDDRGRTNLVRVSYFAHHSLYSDLGTTTRRVVRYALSTIYFSGETKFVRSLAAKLPLSFFFLQHELFG